MTLFHASEQVEAGGTRKVECELAAVAFGKVAESLASLPVGTALRCEGFVARRYRTGITLALHIDRYTELSKEPNTQLSWQPRDSSELKQTEGN